MLQLQQDSNKVELKIHSIICRHDYSKDRINRLKGFKQLEFMQCFFY